jgi:carotenoid cleavage dioxygenase
MNAGPYLADNYGAVDKELTLTNLPVIGKIPSELSGRYLRNGPNPIGTVDLARHHWFVGDGMVHGICIRDGKALWYRNRWVRSAENIEALGESANGRTLAGANNTHVIGLAGTTLAIVESGAPPVELSYELDTVGAYDFFKTHPAVGFSAHPKIDPANGDLHAMCYNWPAWGNVVKHVQVGRDGRVKRTDDVVVAGMTMLHDMSLTANYVVVFDLPVTIDIQLAQAGMRFPFAWNDDYEPRVGLLPRNGGTVVWASVDPCYVFHPMNAYEDNEGRVVVDVCRYERMFAADHHGPFGDSLATLDRWTIDPRSQRVNEQRIDDRAQEFPRCHPALNSKPYRFGYSVAVEGRGFPAILKHDMVSGATVSRSLGAGRHGAEPYFVPRAGANSEDDGYLLNFVYDEGRDASDFLILDARDMAAPPIAEVKLPARVPYGFHGSWIPDGAEGPSV